MTPRTADTVKSDLDTADSETADSETADSETVTADTAEFTSDLRSDSKSATVE
jgi:hypothetical protein